MRYSGMPFRLFRPAALLPFLAWAVVLAIVAWVAAGWYWRLASPRIEQAVPAVNTEVAAVTREIVGRNLFGAPVVAEQAQVVSNSRYKLIGVAANSGRAPGFAILQVDDKASLSAIEGQEIEPGVKLVRVLPRAVEIERNGLRETVPLNESGAGVPPPPIAPAAAPQTFAPAATAPDPNAAARPSPQARPAPAPDGAPAPNSESNSD